MPSPDQLELWATRPLDGDDPDRRDGDLRRARPWPTSPPTGSDGSSSGDARAPAGDCPGRSRDPPARPLPALRPARVRVADPRASFDAILCRNVLIYLDEDERRADARPDGGPAPRRRLAGRRQLRDPPRPAPTAPQARASLYPQGGDCHEQGLAGEASARRSTILVVDDSAVVRQALARSSSRPVLSRPARGRPVRGGRGDEQDRPRPPSSWT